MKKHPKKIRGIPIKDEGLVLQALTHRSWLNEHPKERTQSNERLEFLGDAVLELVVTEELYEKFPEEPEGTLTALRSSLVKTETLARIAQVLELGSHLRLSKGEDATGGRENPQLLANVFEAMVGAIYKDSGKTTVKAFVKKHLFPILEEIITNHLDRDAKSLLQEKVQAKGLPAPIYRVEKEEGPDHSKIFTVAVLVNGERVAKGVGKSKQQAQQEGARSALEKLNPS